MKKLMKKKKKSVKKVKKKSVVKKSVEEMVKEEVERVLNDEFREEEKWREEFDDFIKEEEMKKKKKEKSVVKKSVKKKSVKKEKKMVEKMVDGRLRMSSGECKVEKWVNGVKVLIGVGSFERCMRCVKANAGKGYRLSRSG